MNPRSSIYGPIAKTGFMKNVGTTVLGVEQERLLSRLLFFDQTIVSSVRAEELPFLLRIFGAAGLTHLFETGHLKFSLDTVSVATNLQMNGQRTLPLLEFSQFIASANDYKKLLGKGFHRLQEVTGLKNSERNTICEIVEKGVVMPSPNFGAGLLTQIRKDLRSNSDVVKAVLLRENPGYTQLFGNLSVRHEEVIPGQQRFSTNLRQLANFSIEDEHAALERAVMTITNLNSRLAYMTEYGSITSYSDEDAGLLFGKMSGIIASINPRQEEEQFLRVIQIAGFPKLMSSGRVDVGELLKVRDSDECLQFRRWLQSAECIQASELNSMVTGVKAKVSRFVASPTGKTIRFITNAALGLIPGYGTAASLVEGAVDTFLLDRLLPSSGPVSFLSRSLPSIYK